ncbi:MAG: glycosyltransferase [Bacteroidales bacterium]
MKIISIGPAHPLRGGIADFNERFTKELISLGHDASIISFSLQYPSVFFPGKTQYAPTKDLTKIPIYASINSTNPLTWFQTAKYIREQKPDVVFIQYWMPFFAPALGSIANSIGKKHKTHIIGICHNFVSHEPKPGENTLNRFFIKKCTSAVAMSHTVAQDIREQHKSIKIIETPHPLYDNFGTTISKQEACKTLHLNPDKKYILFFGLVRAYKGLDLLIEACAQLQTPDTHILIAGEFYDSEKKYTDLIKKYSLEDTVTIHNSFIPQDKVHLYFSAADIIAQTYHSATQSGITQIAYHFEKPMLVTNVGGLSEIVPHKKVGYVCEKNPNDIAEALDDFFTHDRTDEFVSNIKQQKQLYTWEYFCKTIFNSLKV